MTDVYTAALLPIKPPSDDDYVFRHCFWAKASLPLTHSAPLITHNTTRICWVVVTLWDCYIHFDIARALSWIFFMYFLLSDGESSRLVKNTEVKLVMKPLHQNLIGNTLVIQPFLSHCSRRSSHFSNLQWCTLSRFSSKGNVNSRRKTCWRLSG